MDMQKILEKQETAGLEVWSGMQRRAEREK